MSSDRGGGHGAVKSRPNPGVWLAIYERETPTSGVYDHILFPTDGSDPADRALDHAISLAREHDATLHVVYVVPSTAIPPNQAGVVAEHLHDAGERIVDRTTERAREAGVHDVTGDVTEGTVHARIEDAVDGRDADLVVMGSRGRSGVSRYLLGSTTERIVREVDVPVLAVETPEE